MSERADKALEAVRLLAQENERLEAENRELLRRTVELEAEVERLWAQREEQA